MNEKVQTWTVFVAESSTSFKYDVKYKGVTNLYVAKTGELHFTTDKEKLVVTTFKYYAEQD